MELMAAAGEGKILVFHHVDDRLSVEPAQPKTDLLPGPSVVYVVWL
jgi:hypothetical protein